MDKAVDSRSKGPEFESREFRFLLHRFELIRLARSSSGPGFEPQPQPQQHFLLRLFHHAGVT